MTDIVSQKMVRDRIRGFGPLIGLTGVSGSGKDTIAEILTRNYGFIRLAFADTLKDIMLDLDPMIPTSSGVLRLSQVLSTHKGWSGAKQNPEIRRLLQVLGTSVRDRVGIHTWSDVIMEQADVIKDPVVITDVRFGNEAKSIHEYQGIVVRIERPGAGLPGIAGKHASEHPIHPSQVDYILRNDGTLDDLALAVDHMMSL